MSKRMYITFFMNVFLAWQWAKGREVVHTNGLYFTFLDRLDPLLEKVLRHLTYCTEP
jgi:hypothetical protein